MRQRWKGSFASVAACVSAAVAASSKMLVLSPTRMIHVRRERVLRVIRAAAVARDHIAKIVLLRRDARDLRELREKLGAHGVFVKRRSRLGEDRADDVEERGGVHGND